MEQVYLEILKTVVTPLRIRVQRTTHVPQLLKPYLGQNLKYKTKIIRKMNSDFPNKFNYLYSMQDIIQVIKLVIGIL